MQIELRKDDFDPYQAIREYEKTLAKGKHGGVVSFVGTMRDFNDGVHVQAMQLDYYPEMTQKHIERVCQEAMQQWPIVDCLVVHRHGRVTPSQAIVLVAVWSAHRAAAFDACRYIINYLKERAPFWKQEITSSGEKRWVEHNTEDPGATNFKNSA